MYIDCRTPFDRTIKPCPFCGGVGEAIRRRDESAMVVRCVSCHSETCGYQMCTAYGTPAAHEPQNSGDMAIQAWNRRVPDTEGEVEELVWRDYRIRNRHMPQGIGLCPTCHEEVFCSNSMALDKPLSVSCSKGHRCYGVERVKVRRREV